MKYLVIPAAKADKERVSRHLNGLAGVDIDDDRYAPQVWVVSFRGTPLKLANLIWPDGMPPAERPLPLGLVIRAPDENINGMAARDFWTLFGDQGNG